MLICRQVPQKGGMLLTPNTGNTCKGPREESKKITGGSSDVQGDTDKLVMQPQAFGQGSCQHPGSNCHETCLAVSQKVKFHSPYLVESKEYIYI